MVYGGRTFHVLTFLKVRSGEPALNGFRRNRSPTTLMQRLLRRLRPLRLPRLAPQAVPPAPAADLA